MSGQEDYVLVPREPTAEMIAGGASVLYDMGTAFADKSYWAKEVYRAMLSAAPASPQPQGADGINAGSVETPGSTLGLSAEACQRSGAAGFDSLTSETLGEYKYQEPSNASVLGPITHPQPSGDGLSEETLREAMRRAREIARRPSPPIPDLQAVLKGLINAVEARVRPTPTDEWRRAVEACARIAEQYVNNSGIMGGPFPDIKKEIAAQIRALSPTKPETPRHTPRKGE